MDMNVLPAFIKINFEGYRGYFVEDLELSGRHLDNGQFSLSYSHEGAEFALQTIIADSPKEAIHQTLNIKGSMQYRDLLSVFQRRYFYWSESSMPPNSLTAKPTILFS